MFLKRGIIASAGLFLAFVGIAAAKSENPQRPDVWRLEHRPVNARVPSAISTEAVSVDHDGDLLPGRNLTSDLGESTHAWRFVFAGGVDASSGLYSTHETFINLSSGDISGLNPGGFAVSTVNVTDADGATFNDNQVYQTTGAPRNVTIYASSAQTVAATPPSGVGFASTATLIGCATFYGYDSRGMFVQERISFSSATVSRSTEAGAGLCQTQDCNEGGRGMGIGNVAFAHISSFTAQISSISSQMAPNINLVVGFGQKIGLAANVLSTGSSAANDRGDVYKVTLSTGDGRDVVRQNPATSISVDFDTIVFPVLPNNVITYNVWIRTRRLWP